MDLLSFTFRFVFRCLPAMHVPDMPAWTPLLRTCISRRQSVPLGRFIRSDMDIHGFPVFQRSFVPEVPPLHVLNVPAWMLSAADTVRSRSGSVKNGYAGHSLWLFLLGR